MGGKARSDKPATISGFHAAQERPYQDICDLLRKEIDLGLPEAESKIWHAHPVWFLNDNPIVGYNKLKGCIRLLFWSGQSFDAQGLTPEGTFKAAEARYADVDEVDPAALAGWLADSRRIQWDYKNIYERKGKLIRLR